MASSDPEIKDGMSLPVWMKSRPTKEFEPFAASPPEDIFYIRYPKTDILFGKPKLDQDISQALAAQSLEGSAAPSYNAVKERDWSKHTKPCQDVMHGIAPITSAVNAISAKPKPVGVDDGFKGEGAACGNSVVKVAHQMITKGSGRGFTVAAPAEEDAEPPAAGGRYQLAARRGSKSLPTTPAHSPHGSPTSRRKMPNRYFTSPFEPTADGSNRSWLTMALLGFKKDFNASTSTLAEEDAVEIRLQGSLAESVENLGPAPNKDKEHRLISNEQSTQQPKLAKPAHTFRPKPSELREMNFWSPTSM